MPDVVGGQHPDEVAVFYDGEGAEAALLKDAVAVGEEVGFGGDDLGWHRPRATACYQRPVAPGFCLKVMLLQAPFSR